DAEEDIYITEGELKAAAACANDFACIGLGGVWSFRAAHDGFFFLPELEKVNWIKRRVYIVYDSDLVTNEKVCSAMNVLAEELYARGALPHAVVLPEGDEGKQGLDDFLLANKTEDFVKLVGEAL